MSKTKALKILKTVLSCAFIALAAYIIISVSVSKAKKQTPHIFGFSFHVVLTDSMLPDIKINDLVIAKKSDISDIKINDDIIFVSPDPDLNDRIIVHRVEDSLTINGATHLVTKGINNEQADQWQVTEIIGRVVHTSAFWGKIFVVLMNPLNLILIFIAIFALKKLIKLIIAKLPKKQKAAVQE